MTQRISINTLMEMHNKDMLNECGKNVLLDEIASIYSTMKIDDRLTEQLKKHIPKGMSMCDYINHIIRSYIGRLRKFEVDYNGKNTQLRQ